MQTSPYIIFPQTYRSALPPVSWSEALTPLCPCDIYTPRSSPSSVCLKGIKNNNSITSQHCQVGRTLTRSCATGIIISYSKALLPQQAHFTNAPTTVCSIRCQVNDSNVVSMTLYLAYIHTCVQLANVCLVIVIAVPQVACLVTWHTELYWMSTQDSCYCVPSINQWWECNTCGIDTLWLVSHLLTVGGRWTWVSICTSALLPQNGKVSKSDRSLPSKTVEVVR